MSLLPQFRPTLFIYIAWQVFLGILTAFLVITGVIMLVDFVELSRTVGSQAGVGFGTVAVLTFLKAPLLIEETLPFVVLFGVMSALFKLNRRSELIIMRAAGLSAWRFLMPGLCVAFAIGLIWSFAMNPLSARSADAFERIKDRVTQAGNPAVTSSEDLAEKIWLREGASLGQTVIFAKTANLETRTLTDVTFYRFRFDDDAKPVFDSRYDAKTAQLTENGYWTLSDVIESRTGALPQPYESISAPTGMSWGTLREAAGQPASPPFWSLPAEITKMRQAGFSTVPLVIKFNRLLALPLTLIAMAIIAAGVSMRLTRLGGTLRLLVVGSALGFGVYFANNMMAAFGETGSLPAILSAWAVSLFVLFAGMARLCTIEDG